MSRTRFAASTTDLPRKECTNHITTNQNRSQPSLADSLSLFPSPPPRELGTERRPTGSKIKTKTRRPVTSIHLSPPVVKDRESSLYPHRVYASPIHDWSKSCNDLGVATSLAASSTLDLNGNHYYPLGIIGNGTGTEPIYIHQQHKKQQHHQSAACLGLYNDTYTTHHQYHSSVALPSSQPATRSTWYSPPRGYRPFQSTLEVNVESDDYVTGPETDIEHSQRSSFTDHSYYLEPLNDTDAAANDFAYPIKTTRTRNKRWYKPFGKFKDLKVFKKVSHHCFDLRKKGQHHDSTRIPLPASVLIPCHTLHPR